jgi:hypothetical protein
MLRIINTWKLVVIQREPLLVQNKAKSYTNQHVEKWSALWPMAVISFQSKIRQNFALSYVFHATEGLFLAIYYLDRSLSHHEPYYYVNLPTRKLKLVKLLHALCTYEDVLNEACRMQEES